ncbi:MAG: PA2169 family four-helix-bundle protein [Acidimicrobiales bacterium]
MSTDEAVTKDLIQTLEDGKEGFAKGAEKLDGTDTPELAATFRKFSEQRADFAAELHELAKEYGDTIKESGSVAGTLHRGWLSLKDALAGSDPGGVLDAAEKGEDHAVKEYDKALAGDVSPTLKTVIERQAAAVKAAHDEVRALRDARKH